MDRNLEYIMEVARTGSIARASQTLYITPSALSKFIQNKERELGVTLFDRMGKRFVLTHAGETYVRWGQQIEELQRGMEEELSNIARGKCGRISLGFPMVLARMITTEIIPDFQKKYPDIEMVLVEDRSLELLKMVESGQLDFSLIMVNSFQDRLEYHSLSTDQLVLAVPKGHPLVDKAVKKKGLKYPYIDMRECARESFITFSNIHTLGRQTNVILEKYGISPAAPVQVQAIDTALHCVAGGLGVSIMLDRLIFDQKYQDKIVPLVFERTPIKMELCLVHHKDHVLTPAMKSLMEICRNYYENKELQFESLPVDTPDEL